MILQWVQLRQMKWGFSKVNYVKNDFFRGKVSIYPTSFVLRQFPCWSSKLQTVTFLANLPMVISVKVIFEFKVLGSRQWKAFLAPGLAGLGDRQHQQITALPRRPKGRHYSVTCNTTSKSSCSVSPYECWHQSMHGRLVEMCECATT